MSIRLRLTLLYSAILALTLLAFSTALYAAQARLTYDSIKSNLARQGDAFANPAQRFPTTARAVDRGGRASAAAGILQLHRARRHAAWPVVADPQPGWAPSWRAPPISET